MNLRFKEGQMVKMTGHDDMIVEGAIGKDTGNLQYGDLLCIYAMNYSKHELQCIKLSDYNIYTISTSDCVLHSICYPLLYYNYRNSGRFNNRGVYRR